MYDYDPNKHLAVTLVQPWHDLPVGLGITLPADKAMELVRQGIAR